MSLIVLDASAAAAWLLPSQATPASDRLLKAWPACRGLAPAIFRVEIRALLLKGERRGWLDRDRTTAALSLVDGLDIAFEAEPDPAELELVMDVARAHGLSFYDALYLDLALRAGAELASRDLGLLAAARHSGVNVHDLSGP